jgi:hypothetical protein
MLPRFAGGRRVSPVLGDPALQILGGIAAKVKIMRDDAGGKGKGRFCAGRALLRDA